MSLGSNVVVKAPSTSRKVVLNWQEADQRGANACGPCDQFPASYTGAVTINVSVRLENEESSNPEVLLADLSDIYFDISFGTDKTEVTVEVDPDSQIRVPASQVSVGIYYPLVRGKVQPPIIATAMVGRNQAGSIPPSRTLQIEPLLGGATSLLRRVPRFAKLAYGIRPDGNVFDIQYYSGPTFLSLSTLSDIVPMAVPAGARFFDVIDSGAGLPGYGAVKFELQL